MLYELVHEKNEGTKDKPRTIRLYRNSKTGTETKLQLIYTDDDKSRWWGFVDLYKIPYARMAMVRNITDLYTIGLSLRDINTWCDELKNILKSNDGEKYEKGYAKVLEMQNIATFSADPIKQQLALCTVYILGDDERIDYFDEEQAQKKLMQWKPFSGMIAFFLTWHTDHIQRSIKRLERISTTVLSLQETQRQQNDQGLSNQ